MKKTILIFLLLASAIWAQPGPVGGPAVATQAEVNAGTVGNKYVSPLTLKNWTGGGGGGGTGADPTASVGLTAVNGVATTFLRSDGAPPLNQSISPTWTGIHAFTPTARTSGIASYFTLNTPADTGITAATESVGVDFATATRTWATNGTVGLQREYFFRGKTYASASATQTFTDIATVAITPPIAGTNVSFSRPHSLLIVDSTSANSSSNSGAFVVTSSLGTSSTSVSIGAGNINAGSSIQAGGSLNVGTTITGGGDLSIGTTHVATVGTIELGAVSDTTLSRLSAGNVGIEGNLIYRAGGTDVPVADGGTGASALTLNNVILGNGTSAVQFVAPGTAGNILTSDGTTWNSTAPAGASALAPTAVKTSNYSVVAGDLVVADVSGGSFTATLPTAPADKTQVAAKVITSASGNALTIACGGSDVINKAGGGTSYSISIVNAGVLMQYKASGAIWYTVSTDLPTGNVYGAEASVASAGTTDLGAVNSINVSITGTTTITSFGAAVAGTYRRGRFTGACPITYNASSMILNGAASYTTAAGDRFEAWSLGSSNWVVNLFKLDGTPIAIGALVYGTNAGATTLIDMPVTSAATIGTEESIALKVDGTTPFKIYSESDGAGGVQNTRIEVNGYQFNRPLTVYATGTVYTMTASDALVDFGTTDPTLVIDKPGTWLIMGRAYVRYNGATYAASQTVTTHLRRTNNTAADVSNATTTATMRVITTITDSVGVMQMPAIIYTTTNSTDSISVYGSVSATPAAGSVEVSEASIVAIRLY